MLIFSGAKKKKISAHTISHSAFFSLRQIHPGTKFPLLNTSYLKRVTKPRNETTLLFLVNTSASFNQRRFIKCCSETATHVDTVTMTTRTSADGKGKNRNAFIYGRLQALFFSRLSDRERGRDRIVAFVYFVKMLKAQSILRRVSIKVN